jgi:hypothetical protein
LKPELSIVVTSRNDDHGGDALKRMTIFVNGLIAQTNKFELPCELVFVDWNPPEHKPLLHEVLPKPKMGDYLTIKYVVVPAQINQKLKYSNIIPLFQMIAKNVGIRRASADFILCTNIDLLFSNELFEWMKSSKWEQGVFYRANRCDVPSTIDEKSSVEDQLNFCFKNILKRNGVDRDNPYDLVKEYYKFTFKFKILKPLQKYLYNASKEMYKIPYHRIMALDSDACGDFTLMHKNDWLAIKGYMELEMYSLHIDTIALMAADAIGMKQAILPKEMCTYHISHADGWDSMDPIKKILFYQRKPTLDYQSVKELGEAMMNKKEVLTINKDDWGYANENFTEYSFPS